MCISTSISLNVFSSHRIVVPISECEVLSYAQEATVNFSINKVIADRAVDSQRVDEVYFKFLNRNNVEFVVCNNQLHGNFLANQFKSGRSTVQVVFLMQTDDT